MCAPGQVLPHMVFHLVLHQVLWWAGQTHLHPPYIELREGQRASREGRTPVKPSPSHSQGSRLSGGPLATPAKQLIIRCDFLEYSQPPLTSHAQCWVWRRHSESEHKCFPGYLNVMEATVVNWSPHTSFHLPECARVTSNS